MLSKAKAFSKVIQYSSRVSSVSLQGQNRFFFASAPQYNDIGVGAKVDATGTGYIKASQPKVNFFCK